MTYVPDVTEQGDYRYYRCRPPVGSLWSYFGVYFRRTVEPKKYAYTISRLPTDKGLLMEQSYTFGRWRANGEVTLTNIDWNNYYLKPLYNEEAEGMFWYYILERKEEKQEDNFEILEDNIQSDENKNIKVTKKRKNKKNNTTE